MRCIRPSSLFQERLNEEQSLRISTTIVLLVAAAAAPAQEKPEGPPRAQGRGNMGRSIVLGPDDVRAFPDAPADFNTRRAGVPAGRIEPFEYDSRVT